MSDLSELIKRLRRRSAAHGLPAEAIIAALITRPDILEVLAFDVKKARTEELQRRKSEKKAR